MKYISKNTYSIEQFTSDSIKLTQFNDLCHFIKLQESINSSHPAISNMGYQADNGMLFNIFNKIRWTDILGSISILRANKEIIGVSCVEYSTIGKNLGIGGIRCWIDNNYRTDQLATKYLLSSNLEWCIDKQLDGMILSFNDYNKWLYNAIKRKSLGKAAGLSNVWSNWWNDCIIIDRQLEIRHTLQWCVIKPIKDIDIECI